MPFVFTHQIAGLTFCTESNLRFTRLERTTYQPFRVHGERAADVHHRIHGVHADTLTLSLPGEREREQLLRCMRWPGGLDDPILRSPAVWERLQACLDRPEQVDIRASLHQVDIRDFSCSELGIIYVASIPVCRRHDEAYPTYSPEYYIAANFPQIFSSFLPNFSAFMMHSSGVIRGDKAALFVAPDSGGKTTVLRLLDSGTVLSDDQIILRQEGTTIVAHSTPFGTITGGPCQAILGAIFMLDRGPRFELTPVAPADLVRCLWTENLSYTNCVFKDHELY